MSIKPRSKASPRKRQLADAKRYLWHMQPEWVAKFNHEHWWKRAAEDKCLEAAVWELLRRHPRAKALLAGRGLHRHSPDLLWTIHVSGLQSWSAALKRR